MTVFESLLNSPVQVVNVGLECFADNLREIEIPVIQLNWSPPRQADHKLAALLAKLGS